MQKALFTDLDGTLLNDRGQITEKNREAIRAFTEDGHQFILATGRPLLSGILQAQSLGLDREGCYMIAFNGCILYDLGRKKTLFRTALPLPVTREIFRLAREFGLHIQTYDEKDVLAEPDSDRQILEGYCKRLGVSYRILPQIADLTREPEKILVIELQDLAKLDAFHQALEELAGDQIDAYHSNPNYLEIVVKGMNKGKALERMCGLLGIPAEGTCAAGDAANDIGMLGAAHIGYAVANADPAVKAAADRVTVHDNNHDAIAEIIEALLAE